MINTSTEYKKAISGPNRVFRVSDRITFTDGTTLQLSMEDFTAYSINEATSSSGNFDIGAAVIKEYSATLNNEGGKFDNYNFDGAYIVATISLLLESEKWENIQRGTYQIVSAKASEMTTQIKAYDRMLYFDKPYSDSNLQYPATITQIIRNACTDCSRSLDASTVQMGNYTVKERPQDEALTYRDIISYCAQIMGCYARIDRYGHLVFGWYPFDAVPQGLDGGAFDDNMPYASGNKADGGTLTNYSSGYTYDAGEFSTSERYHHIYRLFSQSINTDDITITGIQVSSDGSGEDAKNVLYGKEGYVLEISGNPLIQTGAAEQVAQHIGEKLVGNTFRPLSVSCQSDPSMEAGDAALVTDRKQRSYTTVITNTTFTLGSSQKVECSAQTPTENNYTKYGATTKLLAESKKQTEEVLSAYDIAVQNLNQLAANTMGFYATTLTLADGSILAYRHDKPNLADSKIVYKSGIDGFFVTTDYQGTDEATTTAEKWQSGFDASGNAVANILSVIGINFDWASGGTLTLGGSANVNGVLRILNASGKVIGAWTKDGIETTTGKFENCEIDNSAISNATIKKASMKDIDIVGGTIDFYTGNYHVRIGSNGFRIINEDTIAGGSSTTRLVDVGRTSSSNPYGNVTVRDTYNGNSVIVSGNGSISATTSISSPTYNNTSDKKYKEHIEEVDEKYRDLLHRLRPVTHIWKGKDDNRRHISFIAQEVRDAAGLCGIEEEELGLLNEVQEEDGDGNVIGSHYALAYTEFIPLIVKELQKLREENRILKAEFDKITEGGI